MTTGSLASSTDLVSPASALPSANHVVGTGALLGAGVPAAGAVLAYWFASPTIAFFFVIGILPGLVCGAALAEEAVRSPSPALVALKATLLGVPLGLLAALFLPTLLGFLLVATATSYPLSGVSVSAPIDQQSECRSFVYEGTVEPAASEPAYEPPAHEPPPDPEPFDTAPPLLGFLSVMWVLLLVLTVSFAIGLPIGFPTAFVAIVLLRRLVRMTVRRAAMILAVLVLAVAVGGLSAWIDAAVRYQGSNGGSSTSLEMVCE